MLDLTTKVPESTAYFDPNYTIGGGATGYSSPARRTSSRRRTEEYGGGDSTPQLWRMSPTRGQSHYQSMSPASKAQAIARGQRELMDMVRTMPEGCFELSLRDLVEKPWERPVDQSLNRVDDSGSEFQGSGFQNPKDEIVTKKSSGNAKIVRSGSMEGSRGGGFLLKMVFPVPVGSSAKRKSKSTKNNTPASSKNTSVVKTKVSPKPCGNKNEDTDWWKRKIPVLEVSESARSTAGSSSRSSSSTAGSSRRNNSSSSNRLGGPILPSCCFFVRPKKSHEHPQLKVNGLQEL